jgi:hypothetical protein
MSPRYPALVVIILVICYAVPIIPCGLPADTWPEADAERVKAAIYEVVPHLNKLYFAQARKDEKEARPFYNLVAKFGVNNMRRTILGSWRFGTSSEYTYAFGVRGLLNMPHTRADPQEQTAQVTPETLHAFLEWAKTASIDPDTGFYAESNATKIGVHEN